MDGRNQKRPNLAQRALIRSLFTRQAENFAAENQVKSNLFTRLVLENHLAVGIERSLIANKMVEQSAVDIAEAKILGKHMMVDFKLSDLFLRQLKSKEKPAEFIHEILLNAAKISGATILKESSFIGDGFGNFTSIIPFEESHILGHIHSGYFILDGFTCGDIDFIKAINHITQKLSLSSRDSITFRRGIQRADTFVPGIATEISSNTLKFFTPKAGATLVVGHHRVAEFYQCDAGIINDSDEVSSKFNDALIDAGLTPVSSFIHTFSPQGITIVALAKGDLGEICTVTMHNWPEHRYAAIDGCALGSGIDLGKIVDYLAAAFDAKRVFQAEFTRGNLDDRFGLSNQIAEPELMEHRSGMKKF